MRACASRSSFDLSDAVTSYQVRAQGHTLDGRLGESTTLIRARKPFSVEPKIPIEITNNDKIDLPITVSNDTATKRDVRVRLSAKYLDLAGAKGLVARLLPFATSYQDADAWVVVRHTVLKTARLPAVELHESGSKYLTKESQELAKRVSNEIDRGNDALAKYLSQPFFVAEPWTSIPGVITERAEMLLTIRGL